MKTSKSFFFLLLIFPFTNLLGDIINVPADIDSIQGGINLANDGDTVLVQPGRYIETINFHGKNITVGSLTLTTGNKSYISQTIIDGNQNSNGVIFRGGEDSTAVLLGFTLANGRNFIECDLCFYIGGGITCLASNPTLSDLIITGTVAKGNGSSIGIYMAYSNPKISNVKITENSGIGLGCSDSNPTLKNVEISNNSSWEPAVQCRRSEIKLINCTISGNKSVTGIDFAGIQISDDSKLYIINSIICNNTQPEIGIWAVADDDLINSILISNSLLQGGMNGIHIFEGAENDLYWLDGNIDTDPMFVDTTNRDYKLNEGSPCIDAGVQDTMIIYNNEQDTLIIPQMDFVGAAPDMGAYEFGSPSKIEEQIEIPERYNLSQNYPNPFNPITTIEFSLPQSEFTTLKVYNILGKEVATLVSKKLNQGNHTYQFDGKNLASGVYYYQLVAGDYREVKKMIPLK